MHSICIYSVMKFKMKSTPKAFKKPWFRIGDRVHLLELATGVYLFFCGCYDIAFGKNHYFIYLFVQALAFFIMGFGYVGTFVPSSAITMNCSFSSRVLLPSTTYGSRLSPSTPPCF